MTHIFFVNSFITYLCALGALSRLPCKADNSQIVTTRPLPTLRSENIQQFPFSEWKSPFHPSPFFWKKKKSLKYLDEFIDSISSSEFHVYVPRTSTHYFPLINTSPKCSGFSLLEEGFASYSVRIQSLFSQKTTPKFAPVYKRALQKICYGSRYPRRSPFYSLLYDQVFCFSPNAFCGFSRRRELSLRDAITQFPKPPQSRNLPEGCPIIVFDGRLDCDEKSRKFLDSIASALWKLNLVRGANVYFKRHPSHYKKEQIISWAIKYLAQLSPYEKFVELPHDVPLEVLAADRPDIVFLIGQSSVGIYAHFLGATVYRVDRSCRRDLMSQVFPELRFL
jgi:hypothetical protein